MQTKTTVVLEDPYMLLKNKNKIKIKIKALTSNWSGGTLLLQENIF